MKDPSSLFIFPVLRRLRKQKSGPRAAFPRSFLVFHRKKSGSRGVQGTGGIGVELHAGGVARQELVVALGADHSAVVPAEGQGRQVEPAAPGVAGRLQLGPDDGVGGHTAGGSPVCGSR